MVNTIKISKYTPADHGDVLRLLLELHDGYFFQNASPQIQEINREKDLNQSYESYLSLVEQKNGNTWLILVARSLETEAVGFIIGSIEDDDSLVLDKAGKIEDWFVTEKFRGQGVGAELYAMLENWFIGNGCKKVHSDTWEGNDLSIKVHGLSGFFVSGISFDKKL